MGDIEAWEAWESRVHSGDSLGSSTSSDADLCEMGKFQLRLGSEQHTLWAADWEMCPPCHADPKELCPACAILKRSH